MRDSVGVAILTYKNFGTTLPQTPESLTKQEYRDFRLYVVYKPSPEDNTLAILNNYTGKLDITVIIQREGMFEEALNLTFRGISEDLLIFLDDDAIASKQFVSQHINVHLEHPEIGLLGGYVEPMRNLEARGSRADALARKLLRINKPLNPVLTGYSSYPNTAGLLAYNEPVYRPNELTRTMWIEGVNMSAKKEAYQGFEVPCASLRGSGNEILIGLNAIKKGLQVARTSHCYVNHLDRESLSRPRSKLEQFLWHLEHPLMPYKISRTYGHVNTQHLARYHSYISLLRNVGCLTRGKTGPYIFSHDLLLPLAIRAIKNNYNPLTIRNILKEMTEYLKAKPPTCKSLKVLTQITWPS